MCSNDFNLDVSWKAQFNDEFKDDCHDEPHGRWLEKNSHLLLLHYFIDISMT